MGEEEALLNPVTQRAIQGPAVMKLLVSIQEMRNLRPHPRPTESEAAF